MIILLTVIAILAIIGFAAYRALTYADVARAYADSILEDRMRASIGCKCIVTTPKVKARYEKLMEE